MRIVFEPSAADGTVIAPASKSELHRAIICAALAHGESVINGAAYSRDVCATLECAKRLGCTVVTGADVIKINGTGGYVIPTGVLDCIESASTLRFLLPVCLLSGERVTLTGSQRLFSRPLDVYESICRQQNIFFEKGRDYVTVCGKIHSGKFTVKGNISSQFISGLMLALPLIDGDSVIEIVPPFESESYAVMTEKMMKHYGVDAKIEGNTVKITGGSRYMCCDTAICGDWSNAAVLKAMGISVTGLDENSTQGDRVCTQLLEQLNNGFCKINLSDCPDLAPILFSYAAVHNGAEFTGTDRLKYKESDRLLCMKVELAKTGIMMKMRDNSVTIEKAELIRPEKPLFSHNDHRIAMSLSYLLSITGGVLDGAQSVNKSYPDFFKDINGAGVKLHYEYDI